MARPRLEVAETALRQVVDLGYRPSDVRHIAPTHLDLDHAGESARFPRRGSCCRRCSRQPRTVEPDHRAKRHRAAQISAGQKMGQSEEGEPGSISGGAGDTRNPCDESVTASGHPGGIAASRSGVGRLAAPLRRRLFSSRKACSTGCRRVCALAPESMVSVNNAQRLNQARLRE